MMTKVLSWLFWPLRFLAQKIKRNPPSPISPPEKPSAWYAVLPDDVLETGEPFYVPILFNPYTGNEMTMQTDGSEPPHPLSFWERIMPLSQYEAIWYKRTGQTPQDPEDEEYYENLKQYWREHEKDISEEEIEKRIQEIKDRQLRIWREYHRLMASESLEAYLRGEVPSSGKTQTSQEVDASPPEACPKPTPKP